ncbi:hypothetical protein N177_0355 [Lutibaculum baratangense AMV1]|uniref:Uncharacterized protein n=1 Tax=Lutibaculum baratangense AMV1 TaxID=631454 RepID=V4RVH6_9HYPH|nr:hypothetical protein N177_0355 [Lutibaculum baratangense AMV1]
MSFSLSANRSISASSASLLPFSKPLSTLMQYRSKRVDRRRARRRASDAGIRPSALRGGLSREEVHEM